jgi:predicted transcriptional regulator of viral defense system
MKWGPLLALVGELPVFSSGLLLAGNVSPQQVRLQLDRWVKSGRLLQLRRGVYAIAPPWRKVEPHPFVVANALQRSSYVSLQSALSYHGVIPEHVPVVTSVGPGRPETLRNLLGTFRFQRLAPHLRFGYSRIEVKRGQLAFVAGAEKALLDLVQLTPGGDRQPHLAELRLQNPDAMDCNLLHELADRSGKPKLKRAARTATRLLTAEQGELL